MDPHETKIYYVLLIGITVLLSLMVFFVVTILRYHRKISFYRRQRIKENVNTLENERKRVAIDLHDDLGSSLSAIKLHLSRLSKRGDKNFKAVQEIGLQVDELMGRMKGVAHELMPRELVRSGLDRALQLLVARSTDSSGIPIEYSCSVDHFNRENSIHIYRIAQEVLNNAAKHSKATWIHFSISRRNGKILIKISDNGVGFNVKMTSGTGKGQGLHNISARTQLMNGTVYITSMKNQGVTYEIEIPENDEQ